MKFVFWSITYIILTSLLVIFFVKEKKIMAFFKEKEELFANKLENIGDERKNKYVKIADVITSIGISIVVLFYFLIDKTPDSTMPIKVKLIYLILIGYIAILSMRKYHEFLILTSLIMLVLGKAMFNIQDINFYILLWLMLFVGIATILLYRKQLSSSFHTIETTVTAITIVLIIQTYFLGNFVVPTPSMFPTIEPKDRFFANMVIYKFTHPKVADIISFKEPMANKVMYTKRLVGEAGTTIQIAEDGKLMLDGKYSGLPVAYEARGLMSNHELFYIPKKGDKIKIDKIWAINKSVGHKKSDDSRIAFVDWDNTYGTGNKFVELTPAEFYSQIQTKENFKEIIANNNSYNYDKEDDYKNNIYYTFTLKVEGRSERVLPILDFKYNDVLFNKLLSGETITLDHNYYIAMGDNTGDSLDSRYWGNVQDNRIGGKLLFRFWPLPKFGPIK